MKEEKKKVQERVGEIITDQNGNEWIITHIWEHRKHFDLELRNPILGYSSIRKVKKQKPQTQTL